MTAQGGPSGPRQRKRGAIVPCLALLLLVMACSSSLTKPSVSGWEASQAGVASLKDTLFTSGDEELFYEGIIRLRGAAQASEYDKACEALTAVLERYPKSKWRDPAKACLTLIEQRRVMLDKSSDDQKLIGGLRKEKAEVLQDKEGLRLANEKLNAEIARLLQENEQLKKDIQLLKELEIQLDKRDRMLR